jgi:hypothetical protein
MCRGRYCRPDLGFRFLAESVHHHPPTLAWCAESLDSAALAAATGAVRGEPPYDGDDDDDGRVGGRYVLWGDLEAQVAFSGRSAELRPQGRLHLQLPQWCGGCCVVLGGRFD